MHILDFANAVILEIEVGKIAAKIKVLQLADSVVEKVKDL